MAIDNLWSETTFVWITLWTIIIVPFRGEQMLSTASMVEAALQKQLCGIFPKIKISYCSPSHNHNTISHMTH